MSSPRRIKGQSPAPAIVTGPGAGTGAAGLILPNSSNIAGRIRITTGAAGLVGNAIVCTITFHASEVFTTPPHVMLTPANSAAGGLNTTRYVYVNQAGITVTTWTINVGATALVASTVYEFFYQVMQ